MRTDRPSAGRGFTLRGNRSGAAYVLAVTTLLVGVTLALAMIRGAGAQFFAEDSRQKKLAAVNLAEAGVDYAYWQVHYNAQPLPYSATISLGGGTFTVQAVDDGAREASTMLVTSTGAVGGHSHTVKRVTLGLLPYHYRYCENKNADEGNTVVATGSGLGIRANGQIKFDSIFTNVNTGGWATTTVSSKGYLWPRYPNSPPILFPDIDQSYYASIADITQYGNAYVTNINLPGGAVVVVNGDLNLAGWYRGAITIFATGDITIRGSVYPYDQDSYLALLTKGDINIQSLAGFAQGVFYAHKPDGGGDINISGVTTMRGATIADDLHTSSSLTLERDSRLDLSVMRKLRLPGL